MKETPQTIYHVHRVLTWEFDIWQDAEHERFHIEADILDRGDAGSTVTITRRWPNTQAESIQLDLQALGPIQEVLSEIRVTASRPSLSCIEPEKGDQQ